MSLKILCLIGVLAVSLAHAGEFSKIDHAVREEIAEHYNVAEEAAWNLDLTDNESELCFVTVTGLVKVLKATRRFWVCVMRDESSEYHGEWIKDSLVADSRLK